MSLRLPSSNLKLNELRSISLQNVCPTQKPNPFPSHIDITSSKYDKNVSNCSTFAIRSLYSATLAAVI